MPRGGRRAFGFGARGVPVAPLNLPRSPPCYQVGGAMNSGDTGGRDRRGAGSADVPSDVWKRSEAMEAKIRANWLKFTIRSAKRHATLSEPILAAVPSALRDEIRAAGPLSWIPARAFGELCEAVRLGCGSLGARTFFRQSLHDAITQPLMKPLVHGALHVWGRSPASLVRRTPQAWQLVTKNCGELRVVETTEPNAIILRVERVPTSCRVLGLLHMWEGGFVGQMDWVRFQGNVETRAEDFARLGAAEFVIRWK
jgi:hypothetical protein